jgi:D-alanyl-D-alanine carboxypeptidase
MTSRSEQASAVANRREALNYPASGVPYRARRPFSRFNRAIAAAWTLAAVTVVSACGAPASKSPAGSPLARSVQPSPSPVQPEDLQGWLDQLAQSTGGAVALVRSREETWRGASGDAADGRPAEPGDRFSIASTTKTFVATVVLQLVGEGRLSLDDNAESLMPDGVLQLEGITVRQLLNHTSGIGTNSPPGAKHSYSNTNYAILGEIVEQVTGNPLEMEVLDRIFRPLGLADSSYGSASVGTDPDDLPAWLGAPAGSGEPASSGGIVSTTADLATFFEALLGGELLGEDELSEMLRTVDTSGDPLAARGAENSAGAGLGIFRLDLDCGSAWGHGGDLIGPGYSNQVLVSRDGSSIVIVAQNRMGWPRANATAIAMYCL